MYLKYLQIVNYKNIKSSCFRFEKGANTIIGENDSGKSNAMTALRILLDDSYYYNTKRLKESDFSDELDNWRGHWIIISAYFDEISTEEKNNEVYKDIIPTKENEDFLKSYIRCQGYNYGTVTLYIRPRKEIRKKLSELATKEDFEEERKKITLSDYEFYYTSRSQIDFTNDESYEKIVGNFANGIYCNPDEEDNKLLGGKLDILEVWKYISIEFIDALRDVELELRKPKNPIRKVIDVIQSDISKCDIEEIREKIQELNKTISSVQQISDIGNKINDKLNEMIGMVYSPNIKLKSQMKDDISLLSRYLTMVPSDKQDISLLGLGHLNMLYIALKLLEFDVNREQELVNIMIIEEPEAHIHTHIQKTLFDNLKISKKYTQVLMTSHSTYLSEVSEINSVNVMKCDGCISEVMQPSHSLDSFGNEKLRLKDVSLTKCLERYLDAKRSVLLFSKGVILVEGDGEEILLPNLVKITLGVSLDELGIGLVNVGSVAFENIACVFDTKRLKRYCAIITDLDMTVNGAKKSSGRAETLGKSRKEKLKELFGDNPYIDTFYAPHTLEVDFAEIESNRNFVKLVINHHYVDEATIKKHTENIDGENAERYDSVITLANDMGKGWYATVLSSVLDKYAIIPDYILSAIAFVSREVISDSIKYKMVCYSLSAYETNEKATSLLTRRATVVTDEDKKRFVQEFCKEFNNDIVSKFIEKVDKYGE